MAIVQLISASLGRYWLSILCSTDETDLIFVISKIYKLGGRIIPFCSVIVCLCLKYVRFESNRNINSTFITKDCLASVTITFAQMILSVFNFLSVTQL